MATLPILVSGPDKYHSAYGPIIFNVINNDFTSTTKDYNLKIVVNHKGKNETINLTRPFIITPPNDLPGMPGSDPGAPGLPAQPPRVSFDVSGVVRNFFEERAFPLYVSSAAVDKKLFVKYSCEGKTYVALNAAAEVGTTGSLIRYQGCILSALPVLKRYAGYDFDVSILCGDTATSPFVANAVNRVDPSFLPIEYLQDEVGNFIQDEEGNKIVVNAIEVIQTPIPRNPFYVRWINRLGGVDYWMFGNSQEVSIGVKGTKTLLSYPTGYNSAFGIEAENSIVVGASGISKKEWDVLSLLPLSPQIEWYNEKIDKWLTITVDKSENTINTNRSLHEVEFTFNLPTLQIQFA